MKLDDPTLQFAVGTIGGAGGVLVGIAAEHALGLPPGSASVVGTVAGGTVGLEAAKYWPDIRELGFERSVDEFLARLGLADRAKSHMLRKFAEDLTRENSPLPESFRVAGALADIAKKIPIGTRAASQFRNDLNIAKASYRPSIGATSDGVPDSAAINALRSLDRPLRVDCTAIEPAVLASMCVMRDRFGVPLEIGSDAINGRHQVIQAGAKLETQNPFDLILCATAPFLFYSIRGTRGAFQSEYRFVLPIHKERQFVLRNRKGTQPIDDLAGIRTIRFLELSSAEEQYASIFKETRTKFTKMEVGLGDIPRIASDLRDDEAIILYEPAASKVMQSTNLVRVGGPFLDYGVWIGLFCRDELFAKPGIREAITECFVAAWVYCCQNKSEAKSYLLETDSGLIEAFRNAVRTLKQV